jgi:hypothetical protein
MPKVYLNVDEWYPVYSAASEENYHDNDEEFEVDQETLDRWQSAAELFDIAQSEMAMLYQERRKKVLKQKQAGEEKLYDPVTGRSV